jgi:hypothetical protein
MSEPIMVKVSRDGKEIGVYPSREAIRLLTLGTLKFTDFYWHVGMAEWAPLSTLQASEVRRLLAEKELQQANDKKRKEAQIDREKDEDVTVGNPRVTGGSGPASVGDGFGTKPSANSFSCQCCKATFYKPADPRNLFWEGCGIILLAAFLGVFLFVAAPSFRPDILVGLLVAAALVALVLMVGWGLILMLSAGLRSPYCPGCFSTNYSRPNSDPSPVFD